MNRRTNPRILAIGAALALGLLAGCGDDDAVDEAATTAESVVEDGTITDDEAQDLADEAADAVDEAADAVDEAADDAADAADEAADTVDAAEGATMADLEAAVGDEELATLFDVLDAAGFDDIAEAESFTFFAPNDGAFDAVDADLLGELLADPDALRDVLRDHLLDQVVLAADIPADGSVTTTGGLELTFDLSGDQPTVNGIPIVETDVTVDDRGVIHVIDGLLLEQ